VILLIIEVNLFGGFILYIMTKLYAHLIAFSLHELVELIEIAILLKFQN